MRMTWNEETYAKWSQPLKDTSWGVSFLNNWNKALTYVCYVLYPSLLIWLFFRGGCSFANLDCWKALLVPMVGFALLTVIRKSINAPRPYEVMDIEPLIFKSTKGKSFPSRHVFSCFAIAMTWLYFFWPVGVFLLLVGVDLACVRVIGGVHWPKDVLAAALAAILWSLLGFWVIP